MTPVLSRCSSTWASSYGQRGDKLQLKALGLQEMRQWTMVVAGGFKADPDWVLQLMQVIGKTAKLHGGVPQNQALAASPAGCVDEHLVA
jgi:hypothetical protein